MFRRSSRPATVAFNRRFKNQSRRNNKSTTVIMNSNSNSRRRRNGRVNLNAARKGETVLTDRVYVGSLTKNGIKIPIGPDPGVFANQKLVQNALCYQLYRVISYSVIYETCLNQTIGTSNICIWQSSDVKSELPTDDKNVKIASSNSNGINFFATNNKTYTPVLPQFKYNAFSTGGGDTSGGTGFEPACLAFVAVTGAATDITNYGEVWLKITLAVSNPAAPQTVAAAPAPNLPEKNKWIQMTQEANNIFTTAGYTKYILTQGSAMNKQILLYAGKQPTSPAIIDSTKQVYYTDSESFPEAPNGINQFASYHYDEDEEQWVVDEATISRAPFVQLDKPVVLANVSTNSHGNKFKSDSVPMFLAEPSSSSKNKTTYITIKDENNNDVFTIPAYLYDQLKNIKVDVENEVDVKVINEPNVNVINEVDVNVTNEELKVHIDDQPIEVHNEKSTMDTIMDIGETIISIL